MKLGELLRARATGGQKTGGPEAVAPDRPARTDGEAVSIEVDKIRPSPYQARHVADQEQLEELAQSIREHGILQPLLLRPIDGGYELMAGERRLRAARLAGLTAVPAIVRQVDDRTAAQWGLVENLQRADLHFFEEAEGYRRLVDEFGLTQEELARRVGRSQSSVANKLRLLRLSTDVRRLVEAGRLGERHTRALLRLEKEEDRLAAARRIADQGLNADQSERLVEQMLKGAPPRRHVRGSYGDARIFVNGLRQVVRKARQSGLEASLEEKEEGAGWVFVVKLSRTVAGGQQKRQGERIGTRSGDR